MADADEIPDVSGIRFAASSSPNSCHGISLDTSAETRPLVSTQEEPCPALAINVEETHRLGPAAGCQCDITSILAYEPYRGYVQYFNLRPSRVKTLASHLRTPSLLQGLSISTPARAHALTPR